ncbi:unnamed protein product [Caenorhabditis nigoni]
MGPLPYLMDNGKQGKAYILIYTCLVTRGTILKVIPDATTVRYILALKTIFHEVGVPSSIFRDNAETFNLGSKLVNQDIASFEHSCSLTSYLAAEQITYKTITPLSPWQGGVYERVVGLVKGQLYKIGGARVFDYHSLVYIVSNCQSMVNNRPLTPFSRGPGDTIALRPIDFINPGVLTEIPLEFDSNNVPTNTETTVRNHLVAINSALEQLWKMWSLAYVTQLREAMHAEKRCSQLEPKVGDVVIIVTKLVKRHKWPLGIIVGVQESVRDGQIRTAQVKCRGVVYSRAVCQLIPLEINPSNTPKGKKATETHNTQNLPEPATLKPDVRYSPELFPSDNMPNILETLKIGKPKNTTEPSNHHETIGEEGLEKEEPLEFPDEQTYIDPLYQDPNTVVPDHGQLRQPVGRAREYLPRSSKAKKIDYALIAGVSGTPSPPGECCRVHLKMHKLNNSKVF